MKKTILFDLDGTLIDSTPAILSGFDTAFKFHSKPTPKANDIKVLIGHPLDIIFSRLGVENSVIDSYIAVYKAKYKEIYLEQTTLLDFAKDALLLADQIADVGVVTTKTTKYSIDILENLGVIKFIKNVIGRDDVMHPKPNPEPINLALTRLGKTSDEHRKNAFMIGDTPMDILAAKSANITGLAVLCGYGTLSDLQTYSSHIFDNSFQAVEFIAGQI